ncbi:MAG: tRNA (adenosine(37)-N6)-dimethylallyltransferase MiaA [Proteobacteria bacterium]|nr:tRNA (adenosine(37)-N6)-dimethylallyltransferase MiaA [Pseudomonadota bacterium]
MCGPTAIGKTAVAMAVQDAMGGREHAQLISADSALIYRGMDIGTAKPSAAELEKYPHKLIDIIDPTASYSAAEFVAAADAAILQTVGQGKKPIVVGGTMMYLKCLIEGIADLPATDSATRSALEVELRDQGAGVLHQELSRRDPQVAAGIHPNNHQRLLRALAVTRATGNALSAQWASRASGTLLQRTGCTSETVIMLPSNRALLHQRIAQRFEHMLVAGLLAEVEALMSQGDITRDLPSMRAVGYRQAWSHLLGEIDKPTFVQQGVAATRQLAKRQMTWLRKWPGGSVVTADDPQEALAVIV